MDTDRAALLGIIPMGDEAILTDEMADTRSNQFQDRREGAVDICALPRRLALALFRRVLEHCGNGSFQSNGDLGHRNYPPGFPRRRSIRLRRKPDYPPIL